MRKHFSLLPLAILVATAVQAEELDIINVVSENTGAKGKTNVITTESVNRSTETELKGLLKEEPALNFGGGRGTSQWFTIRGMGQDQVDVKIDDAYTDAQLFHHQGRFVFDPSLFKKVSVQKGTGSASAGIGATSGTIVAETVSAKDLLKEEQDFGFKVNAGVSSNSGWSKGATIYSKVGAFDALISGNWVKERDYKAGNGYKIKNSALGQRGLLAKIGVDLNEDHRIELSRRQERHYGVRALREEFDFAQDGRESVNAPRYRVTTNDTGKIEWTGKNIGFISTAKANVWRTVISREEPTERSKIHLVANGANLNLDSQIGESHLIKYGVNYRDQEGRPNSLTVQNGVQIRNQKKRDVGVYAEGIWGLGAFTLTTGLRYDHFSFRAMDGRKSNKGNLNPSFGLIYEVTKDLSFSASLNYATRSPRFREILLSSGTTRGNPAVYSIAGNIKPEKSRNTEVGFNYKLADSLSLNGSYFWQTIQDTHAFTQIRPGYFEIQNAGKLRNSGYELGAAYKYEGLTLRAGVAYSKPELDGRTVDSTVTAIPIGRTWTTGVSYRFEQPDVEIGWRGRFVQHTSYDTSTNNRGGGSTTTKRPGYGVNDFYVTWKPVENINVNLALNNAFNKYYRSHSQRAGVSTLPEPGRDVRLNVNYTL
ncbi:TonB-dependent receptor [Aggregatibacter actinomycetemcomitans serotype e str. SA2149]|uniref:TonB-dependent receptor domain-containing protein n=1 Tax=Aggregatibacter actinomycetemcomitans TaxID=714 RepID=UPI00077E71FC|nr:TonB-dependent receptor [Aggregatibacter actinomycetemcomitans]KYK76364.1 TonB-dependent receptor [Aggregatibacter actinomycetemcomitans serotype e str. SA2149]KYK78390.1 TonB-dependent receptor [Aggregatibacter actinomycetemcomitans SC383s]